MKKYQVGVIGGNGMVGQRFISLIENHPWFDLKVIAASAHSAGKTYEQAARSRWAIETPFPEKYKGCMALAVDIVQFMCYTIKWLSRKETPLCRL